jgi:hypothetical protein
MLNTAAMTLLHSVHSNQPTWPCMSTPERQQRSDCLIIELRARADFHVALEDGTCF